MLSGDANVPVGLLDCYACYRRSTPMFGQGSPVANVMVVAEVPSLLSRLTQWGLPASTRVTWAVRCPSPEPATTVQAALCGPWVGAEVRHICPFLIIAVGKLASRCFLGPVPDAAPYSGWYSYRPGEVAVPWAPLWLKVRGYNRDSQTIIVYAIEDSSNSIRDDYEIRKFVEACGLDLRS